MKPTSNIKMNINNINKNNNNDSISNLPDNHNVTQNNPILNQTTSSMKFGTLSSIKNINSDNDGCIQPTKYKNINSKNQTKIKKENNRGFDVNIVLGIPFRKSKKRK